MLKEEQMDGQWIFDPVNWSDKKVFAKFQTFGSMDKDKFLHVENRPLMNEEISIASEVFKRTKNIQEIYIDKCMLGDGPFNVICDGMLKLHTLKVISITGNNISSASVDLIIKHFSQAKFSYSLATFGQSLKLEVLDLRNNHLTERDAKLLYENFNDCKLLNGIPIADIRSDLIVDKLDVSKLSLHHAEMTIICMLLQDMPSVEELNISSNLFDISALQLLLNFLETKPLLHSVDMSSNQLMLGPKGNDLTGIEELALHLQTHKSIRTLNLDGIYNIPRNILKQIEQSLQVNRCVSGAKQPGYFESFIKERASKLTPVVRANPLENWEPSWDIDRPFCVLNKVETCDLEYSDKSIRLL